MSARQLLALPVEPPQHRAQRRRGAVIVTTRRGQNNANASGRFPSRQGAGELQFRLRRASNLEVPYARDPDRTLALLATR
jgi:hypothetical protein